MFLGPVIAAQRQRRAQYAAPQDGDEVIVVQRERKGIDQVGEQADGRGDSARDHTADGVGEKPPRFAGDAAAEVIPEISHTVEPAVTTRTSAISNARREGGCGRFGT